MLLRARMIESKSNISSTYIPYIIYLTIVICKGIYQQGIFINMIYGLLVLECGVVLLLPCYLKDSINFLCKLNGQ